MTKNFQDKLHQEERKQSKGAKFVPVFEGNKSEKCSKIFCKIFARQSMQNKANVKHSSNSEDIFKSARTFTVTIQLFHG